MKRVIAVVLPLLWMPSAQAQSSLPIVQGIDWVPARAQGERLLKAFKARNQPLPPEVEAKLQVLLREDIKDADSALERMQNLLDPLCLVFVTINPESRVKAGRGPAPAILGHNQPRLLLIKVYNDAGVTQALKVTGEELRETGKETEGRWLEAAIPTSPPLSRTLTGHSLDYVVLRLKACESGKREATLKFDAGQGTQDLGFRAEVPILFKVKTPGD